MSKKQKRIHHRQVGSSLLLPIVIACAALLASCGGGGGDSTSGTASADSTSQALAVSGTSAVPAGWVGRVPKMEVINGITVPPEPPAAANNTTLAGIDVNGNGVRDDVERVIAKMASGESSFKTSLQYAKSLQFLLQSAVPTTTQQAQALMLSPECAINKQQSVIAPIQYSKVIFNTRDRAAKVKAISALAPPMTSREVSNYVCP